MLVVASQFTGAACALVIKLGLVTINLILVVNFWEINN